MNDAWRFDKRAVRRAFDRAAARYDANAGLQQEVARRLVERSECMRITPECIVDAGCGTGYGSRLLRARFPAARLVGLDLAPAMLRAARKALSPRLRWPPRARRAHQVCGDLERLPFAGASADMVWSSLALQWCNDLDAVFADVWRVLRTDGLFQFATFGPDTLKELRQAFSGLDGDPHVSRFPDMHDVGDALVRAGFSAPVVEMEMFTLTYAELSGLVADLKAIGAHNASAGRRRGLMGKGAWARLERAYEAFRLDGRLPASYEVIYGHAWKSGVSARKTEASLHFVGRGSRA